MANFNGTAADRLSIDHEGLALFVLLLRVEMLEKSLYGLCMSPLDDKRGTGKTLIMYGGFSQCAARDEIETPLEGI